MELSIKDSTEISNLKIVELLKQLAIKQAQKTIVQTKRFGKFVGKSTETQLSEFKEYIEKQAKIYGQNQEKIDDIVKKYKEVLKEIKQKYAEEEKSIIEEKNAYELEETKQQAIRTEEKEKFLEMKENPEYAQTKFGKRRMKITRLINEGKIEEARKVREKLEEYKKTLVQQEKELETKISMIKKSGDISRAVELAEAQNKLEELQPELQFAKCDTNIRNAKKAAAKAIENAKEADKKIEDCKKRLKKEKTKIIDKRENEKLKADTQNIMQKAAAKISMISNKFDKEKKFKERVAEPIKEKINTLKDTICGTVIKAEHNVKTSKTYTKGKEKIGSIIESAKSAKNSIINKLKKKMMNKIKKDEQAIEKYEKENPKKEKAKRTSKKEINEKYNKYTKSGILSSSGLEVAE